MIYPACEHCGRPLRGRRVRGMIRCMYCGRPQPAPAAPEPDAPPAPEPEPTESRRSPWIWIGLALTLAIAAFFGARSTWLRARFGGEATRAEALQEAARSDGAGAVEALERALGDRSPALRETAATTLVSLCATEPRARAAVWRALKADSVARYPPLLEAFARMPAADLGAHLDLVRKHTAREDQRRVALGWLAARGSAGAVAVPAILSSAAGTRDEPEAMSALRAIGRLALPALERALGAQDPNQRQLAARAAVTIALENPPFIRPIVLTMLAHSDAGVRRAVWDVIPAGTALTAALLRAVTLGLGYPGDLPLAAIRRLLTHPKSVATLDLLAPEPAEAFLRVVLALYERRGWARQADLDPVLAVLAPRAWRPIVAAVSQGPTNVRIAAARAAAAMGVDASAILPALTELIGRPDAQTTVLDTLEAIGAPAAGALVTAYDRIEPRHRRRILEALKATRSCRTEVLGLAGRVLGGAAEDQALHAASILASCAKGGLPHLIAGLQHTKASARRAAVAGLLKVPGTLPEIIPALVLLSRDADAELRRDAITALRRHGRTSDAAMGALVDRLEDEAPTVRQSAEEGLRDGGEAARQPLLRTLKHRSAIARAAAARLLAAHISDPAVRRAVKRAALRDADSRVRAAASAALAAARLGP